MLAGLLWPLILGTAYAVFVWYLWRETTAEARASLTTPLALTSPSLSTAGRTRADSESDGMVQVA